MSQAYPTRQIPERNPLTHREHQRQVFWQIILPLAVGVIVVLALAVLVSLSSIETSSRWADISLIFLILPTAVATLLFIAVAAALVYGLWYAIKFIPPYARIVQDFFYNIQRRVRTGADMAAEPVLRVNSWIAGLRAVQRKPKNSRT